MAPRRGLLQGTRTEMLQVCQALAQWDLSTYIRPLGRPQQKQSTVALGRGLGWVCNWELGEEPPRWDFSAAGAAGGCGREVPANLT